MGDQITYDQVEVGAEIAEVSYPATRLSPVTSSDRAAEAAR